MRALKTERLAPSGRRRQAKPKRGGAAARRATAPRRKPPARWRKPLLVAGAAVIAGAAVAGGASWLWHAGYPRAALAWAGETAERAQTAAGLTLAEVMLWGRERTPKEALLRALAVQRGEPILEVDLDLLRARLEAVGWIERATVARRLPDTLEVRIAERSPLALWQQGGKLVLIATDGTAITTTGLERFPELPVVVGKDAPAHAASLIAVLRREPALFGQVEAAVRVGGRRWNLRLEGGVEVRLPEGGEAEAWTRLAALERQHKLLARKLLAIDMRLPDRLIVRLVPGSAARFRDPGEKT